MYTSFQYRTGTASHADDITRAELFLPDVGDIGSKIWWQLPAIRFAPYDTYRGCRKLHCTSLESATILEGRGGRTPRNTAQAEESSASIV